MISSTKARQLERLSLRVLVAGLLLCSASLAWGQSWTVQTLSTRVLSDGKSATIAIAVSRAATAAPSTPPVRHLLVYPQPLGIPQLKVASGNVDLTLGGTWMRALPQLQAQGISLVYVDVPSDAERRGIASRPSREGRLDLQLVARQVQQLFPGAQMHLAGFASVAPGPYPVLVHNHGDVEVDSASVKSKARIRDMVVAREFLQLGVAVLMPARRGVGMSEGNYPKGFSNKDADATYKARVQSEDICPALASLKTRPELDANRVILSGQSAGGHSTMYIASQSPAGLIGAIDFSGGRNDISGVNSYEHDSCLRIPNKGWKHIPCVGLPVESANCACWRATA